MTELLAALLAVLVGAVLEMLGTARARSVSEARAVRLARLERRLGVETVNRRIEAQIAEVQDARILVDGL